MLLIGNSAETGYMWDSTTVADGTFYKLKIEVISSRGLNTSYITNSFSIDNTPPIFTITGPVQQTYLINSITIIFVSDTVSYWYYIESIDTQNQTWSEIIDRTLSDGPFTLYPFGSDNAGNTASVSVVFTIDTTPPTLNVLSPISQTYSTGTITVSFTGDAQSYWYYIESIDTQNQTWSSDVTRDLPNGIYTIHVFGNDSVGNVYLTIITFTIEISISSQTTTRTTSTTPTASSQTTTTSGGSILFFMFSSVVIFSIRIKKRKSNSRKK